MPLVWIASKLMPTLANTPEQQYRIYSVGPLKITHIKNNDKIKNILPPLRIRSDGRPFTKTKLYHFLCQY